MKIQTEDDDTLDAAKGILFAVWITVVGVVCIAAILAIVK